MLSSMHYEDTAMTTCLKTFYDIDNSQLDWSVYHYCGLFALVDDLLRVQTLGRLQRADYILRNIRRFKMTVNAPVNNEEFIEAIVNQAREIAFGDGLSSYLLQETAIELCQGGEHDFDQRWFRFAYYYYMDKVDSLKKVSLG